MYEIQKSLGPDSPESLQDVCEQFAHFVEQLHIKDLHKYLRR